MKEMTKNSQATDAQLHGDSSANSPYKLPTNLTMILWVSLIGAGLILSVMWSGGKANPPTFAPSLYYMVTTSDEMELVNPFPSQADCARYAEQFKSKCYTGSEMMNRVAAKN